MVGAGGWCGCGDGVGEVAEAAVDGGGLGLVFVPLAAEGVSSPEAAIMVVVFGSSWLVPLLRVVAHRGRSPAMGKR